MVLGFNCIYKHFVETKNVLRFVEHLLYSFFFCHKTTIQAFEQNQCHDIIRSSEMKMLFSKQLSAEVKLHKNGFSLKIVLKMIKKGYYYPSFIIRLTKIKALVSFSDFAKLLFCIFIFLGRKNGYLISCCGNIKKRIMCETKTHTRLNNLITCLRFPCLGLNTIIDSIKLTVLL